MVATAATASSLPNHSGLIDWFERSDSTQICVIGLNGNPFIVSARYDGIKTNSWVVQSCIMHSGWHIYEPPDTKGPKNKGSMPAEKVPLPPVLVHDLPPPNLNETVGDTFDNDIILAREEGNPEADEMHLDDGHGLKTPQEKSPFMTWMLDPLICNAVTKTPNISLKAIREILQPYAIDIFITDNLIQNTRKRVCDVRT